MIEVGGRRVKFARGRGRSQTVSIYQPADRGEGYECVLVLEGGTFDNEQELLAGPVDSVEEFVAWLQREYDATPRSALGTQQAAGTHAGLDSLIDRYFGLEGIGEFPHYQHRESALRLSSQSSTRFDGAALVPDLYALLARNVDASGRRPSTKNWRFEEMPKIAPDNTSPEKRLEKAIARIPAWANQVPTASGLVTAYERQRNIDLVHRLAAQRYELIELKVMRKNGDTPLWAAMEILKNGLVFLYSRRHRARLGYSAMMNPVVWAEAAHLRVLADEAFYEDFAALGWLVRFLNRGLHATLSPDLDWNLSIDFAFEAFPKGFSVEARGDELREALAARRLFYS